MKAIILAAGYATRLYPLTLDKPKSLLPVGGKPILDYMMEQVEALPDVTETVLVTNHKYADQFAEWHRHRESATAAIPPKKLTILDDGTMDVNNRLGAIRDMELALRHTGAEEDWLVVAGDNLFAFSLDGFLRFYKEHGKDSLLVQRFDRMEDLRNVGVAVLDSMLRVIRFTEKPPVPQSDIGAFGVYLYRKDTLPLISEYLREGNNPDAPGYFPEWLHKRKELRAYLADGPCWDIGTLEVYREVQKMFESGVNGQGRSDDRKEGSVT